MIFIDERCTREELLTRAGGQAAKRRWSVYTTTRTNTIRVAEYINDSTCKYLQIVLHGDKEMLTRDRGQAAKSSGLSAKQREPTRLESKKKIAIIGDDICR